MVPILIFDDSQVERLNPLTLSRSACELRCGAFTLLERMVKAIGRDIAGILVRDTLAQVIKKRVALPVNPSISTKDGVILVNARWLMLPGLVESGWNGWEEPAAGCAGLEPSAIAWVHLSPAMAAAIDFGQVGVAKTLEAVLPQVQRRNAKVALINRPWDLISHQRKALEADFSAFGAAQKGVLLLGAHQLAPERIHVAKGVTVYPGAVLDAQNGPIILDEGAEVRSHAVLTGPVYVGRKCLIRTAADIREDCSFGPGSRVGGEVIGSIFLGNGGKQHHGFLGQSIVGEWANLGAGTTTSNLKNTYGEVRAPINGVEEPTGRQFLGSIIADHAKIAIGTYLSTGSVVGFASHITIPRPKKFTPSFAWVTEQGIGRMDFEKAEAIAKTVMARRGVEFGLTEHELFVKIAAEWSQMENFNWEGN